MLKIWGRNNSVNVQKVLWCCEEMGVKYERIDAGGQFGVVNTPQYRALNPNGLVPTIEDGPFVLWESNSHRALSHGQAQRGQALARGPQRPAPWPTSGWTSDHHVLADVPAAVLEPGAHARRTSATPRRWKSRACKTAEVLGYLDCASEESHVRRRRRPDHGRHPDGLRQSGAGTGCRSTARSCPTCSAGSTTSGSARRTRTSCCCR